MYGVILMIRNNIFFLFSILIASYNIDTQVVQNFWRVYKIEETT